VPDAADRAQGARGHLGEIVEESIVGLHGSLRLPLSMAALINRTKVIAIPFLGFRT
jgi:hypothetical protein